ncbi:alpha/beta hydrolase [Leucobacter sp. HY1908]
MKTYAQSVAAIHSGALLTEQDVAELLAQVRMNANTIESIALRKGLPLISDWRVAPPTFMPASAGEPVTVLSGDADSFNWSQAAGAWAGALALIEHACTRWRELVTQRESAERALLGALTRTAVTALGPGVGASNGAIVEALTRALSQNRPWESPEVQRLLNGMLTPADVAKLWESLVASETDTNALIERYCVELAGLDGLPFSVRDRAARAAIDYALQGNAELVDVFARLGLSPDDMTLTDFRSDLVAVKDAAKEARKSVTAKDAIVQIAMLGSHDGVVTAAISVGDLDAASRVGVLVSGMNSSVRTMRDGLDGLREVHDKSVGVAMVSWIGYRAPGIAAEATQNRAERGSWPLATFLDGLSATRAARPLTRFAVIGHSYGTNTAAEALKLGGHSVDAYITMGSAGLTVGTKAEELGVSEIHATHARGDNIAPIGKFAHFRSASVDAPGYRSRVDPRDLEGAIVFSSEESEEGKRVTMHNLTEAIDWGPAQWVADGLDGVAKDDEIGYLNPSSTTVNNVIEIMGGKR